MAVVSAHAGVAAADLAFVAVGILEKKRRSSPVWSGGISVAHVHGNTISSFVPGMDETSLRLEVERSRAARLRAWTVLEELRAILTEAGQELPKPSEKSFAEEGRILERGLRKALAERDETLCDLATAARWVDRSAFGKEEGFGQAHQALLKACHCSVLIRVAPLPFL
jgi:hypothetical protein